MELVQFNVFKMDVSPKHRAVAVIKTDLRPRLVDLFRRVPPNRALLKLLRFIHGKISILWREYILFDTKSVQEVS